MTVDWNEGFNCSFILNSAVTATNSGIRNAVSLLYSCIVSPPLIAALSGKCSIIIPLCGGVWVLSLCVCELVTITCLLLETWQHGKIIQLSIVWVHLHWPNCVYPKI